MLRLIRSASVWAHLPSVRRSWLCTAAPLEVYQKKTPVEHILLRPGMYIGACAEQSDKMWTYDADLKSVVLEDVLYNPGLIKLFDEVLVNAVDNSVRGTGQTRISVAIDPGSADGSRAPRITVENDGKGIPVRLHETEGCYVPELVLGHLLTGSNFDDSKEAVTGGRHGYGAKLTNIFSTSFEVETVDSRAGLRYRQQWRDNMKVCDPPVIEPSLGVKDFTRITFVPDVKGFGSSCITAGTLKVMHRRLLDVAGTTRGQVVSLNGEVLPVASFQQYIASFCPPGTSPVFCKLNSRWEFGVVVVEDGNSQPVSFVNGIYTHRGGTHVHAVADTLCKRLAAHLTKHAPNDITVSAAAVRPFLRLFVNCQVPNASFDSQSKDTLVTKLDVTWTLPDKVVKAIAEDTGLMDAVYTALQSREDQAFLRQVRRSKQAASIRSIPKLEDANEAGGRRAAECTLILTEGDSAKALAVAGLSVVGRDLFGVFPLRGKLLNVRDLSPKEAMENAEIAHLVSILGLDFKATYEDGPPELRYGHVLIMADQDFDGSHIKGLLINAFHKFWPALLRTDGFLEHFVTPIVKARKGKIVKDFFSVKEYNAWLASDEAQAGSWAVKYYKGLGTSTAAEGRQYFSDLARHRKQFTWSGVQDGDEIVKAFAKSQVEARKSWLLAPPDVNAPTSQAASCSFSQFINNELIEFSRADIVRSIPSVVDGLKPSQRKVLFAAMKRGTTEIKVAQLAGFCAEATAYHHGEASLLATIVKLAQDFVGSNNVPLLMPVGQFGTRLQGGKDAASARYIFTKLSPLCRLLFPAADDELLEYAQDDGRPVEPLHFVPILPTLLLNGCEGIGTGWSTEVPPFHPVQVVDKLLALLGKPASPTLPAGPLQPWYNGFSGRIQAASVPGTFHTFGSVERVSSSELRVTELPIGRWTDDYKSFLVELMQKDKPHGGLLANFKEYHTVSNVDFVLKLSPVGREALSADALSDAELAAKLKLRSSVTMGNMHLFDAHGRIKRYASAEDIITDHMPLREALYVKRKNSGVQALQQQAQMLENRARFVAGVIAGDIAITKCTKAQLEALLLQKGYSPLSPRANAAPSFDYLTGVSLSQLTTDAVAQVLKDVAATRTQLTALQATPVSKIWADELLAFREEAMRGLARSEAPSKPKKQRARAHAS